MGGGTIAGVAIKAFAEPFGGKLDGVVAPKPRITGTIHLAHASGTNLRQDFVRTELVAGGKRHVFESVQFIRS